MDSQESVPGGVNTKVTTTATDLDDLQARLQEWIRQQESDPDLLVQHLERSKASGMSSVTVLFTVVDTDEQTSHYVLRLAPEESAMPVFSDYDLKHQAAVINSVYDFGVVPVPRVRWVEDSSESLGRPFMVMDRVYGVVPQDNPPYVFDSWLRDADSSDQALLQSTSIDILIGIHRTSDFESTYRQDGFSKQTDSLQKVFDSEVQYYNWMVESGGLRFPLIEQGLEWVKSNWPKSPARDVLCWGDARIGNIMYQGFSPAAVVDWEMSTIGPPELDVAWFIFFHRMYQDMAESFQKPGIPGFLRAADVVHYYEAHSGERLSDMKFHLTFAAVRCAIIFARIKQRTVYFGDTPAPATADQYILHHEMLTQLMANTYEWEL